MIKVVFKNLEKSELAKEAVQERFQEVLERFPNLNESRIVVTLSMENSPRQGGPDLFSVKIRVENGSYDGVILEKAAPSLYVALADLCEHLLERLNRFSDKKRVKNRTLERKLALRTS